MAIHLLKNGKAKCGAQRWDGCLPPFSEDPERVTCKRCRGEVRRKFAAPVVTENLVGRILHYSYGYDMTLNDFYVIERQTPTTVIAREIGSQRDGGFSGYEVPDATKKREKRVRFYVRGSAPNGELYFIAGPRYARLHDGGRVYFNELD
jgi:hypothetical protein